MQKPAIFSGMISKFTNKLQLKTKGGWFEDAVGR